MLYQGRIKLWFISVLLLFLLCGNNGYGQSTAKKRKELEAKRKELQLQIQKNKQELQLAKSAENNSLKELEAISNQIVTRERLIDHVTQESFELSIEIANQQKVIETLRNDLDKLKADYAAYLVAAYQKRDVNATLFFVFDSKSLNQAYKRLKYLNSYGNYRQQQANVILNTQKEMIVALERMILIKREKMGLITLKEKEKKELQVDKKEEAVVLTKVQQKVKNLSQKIAEQEKAAKKLNQSLDNLIAAEIAAAKKAEDKKRADASKKSQKASAPKTNTSYLSDADLKLSGSFEANKGKLPWPVSGGFISQTFGAHPHPTLKGVVTTNNGIDISVKPGTQVKPVFNGTVKGIFPIPGMDQVILVNHGEYFTIYACLTSVQVKIGQAIDRNTVLGEIATNPDDGSGKLHFEVWKQRVFQNPAPWLRGK